MIPVILNLQNFMSYKTLSLDFEEIHIACLSGENGAGKSSILDAITWSLWDKARTGNNEDLIRLGESEVSAEFIFRLEEQTYRVLRNTRKMGGKRSSQSALEFQILSDQDNYKSLTGKSIRETQQKIIDTVKMDYHTFVNSSFVLQGKADEFTTKSPLERKKVLAEMLDLSRYDLLQEKSKEKLREAENTKNQLINETQRLKEAIGDEADLSLRKTETETFLQKIEKDWADTEEAINRLIQERENLNSKLAELKQLEKFYQENKKELNEEKENLARISREKEELQKLLLRKAEIEEKFGQFKEKKELDDLFTQKQLSFYRLENDFNRLENEISQEKNKIQGELEKVREKEELALSEKEEQQKNLKDKEKVITHFEKLKKVREEEAELQKKDILFKKLTEKKLELEKILNEEINQLKGREQELKTKIEEREKLSGQLEKLKLEEANLKKRMEEIEKKQVYKENLTEIATKLKLEVEQNKETIEKKKKEIEKYTAKVMQWMEISEAHCPMCNTHLDDTDKQKIIEKYKSDIDLLEQEVDDLSLKNSTSEKKVDEYRKEYRLLNDKINEEKSLPQTYGEIVQRIKSAEKAASENSSLIKDLAEISFKIENNQLNPEIKANLATVCQEIEDTNYNYEMLSSLQGEINSLKWAENKYFLIEQAEKRILQLDEQLPVLAESKNELEKIISSDSFALSQKSELKKLEAEIVALDYRQDEHKKIKEKVEELKDYERLWQEMEKSAFLLNSLAQESEKANLKSEKLETEIQAQAQKIAEIPDFENKINLVQSALKEKSQQKNELIGQANQARTELTKITEKLNLYQQYREEIKKSEEQTLKFEYETVLYKELVTAFGKNGIQSVIIENVIPEIESIANSLLYQMTEGRMNVSFSTRKANKTSDKISETLEILISDELGTRDYEMYSGGEAFRVNFAIRLALSKILARRAGTKLKTLVIDEGFGTQDSKGISRLIEAINTVSDDFEKIIIITHLNELKEAFPSRIEVYKNIHGSSVKVFV